MQSQYTQQLEQHTQEFKPFHHYASQSGSTTMDDIWNREIKRAVHAVPLKKRKFVIEESLQCVQKPSYSFPTELRVTKKDTTLKGPIVIPIYDHIVIIKEPTFIFKEESNSIIPIKTDNLEEKR